MLFRSTLEIHTGIIPKKSRILVVDDVLATGGTAIASIKLLEQEDLSVVGIAFLLQIDGLDGYQKIANQFPNLPIKVVI